MPFDATEAGRKIAADAMREDDGLDGWDVPSFHALRSAYEHAMGRHIETPMWEMPVDGLIRLVQKCRGRCELTGIKFSAVVVNGSRRRPFVPSIDRIQPKGSYSLANCRVVCSMVNIALGDWGDEAFWTIVESAYRRKYG